MFFPSILCPGSFAPIILAIVGKRSIVIAGSEHTELAGIFPGHQANVGSRHPPSNMVPFPSRKGAAEPAWSP